MLHNNAPLTCCQFSPCTVLKMFYNVSLVSCTQKHTRYNRRASGDIWVRLPRSEMITLSKTSAHHETWSSHPVRQGQSSTAKRSCLVSRRLQVRLLSGSSERVAQWQSNVAMASHSLFWPGYVRETPPATSMLSRHRDRKSWAFVGGGQRDADPRSTHGNRHPEQVSVSGLL